MKKISLIAIMALFIIGKNSKAQDIEFHHGAGVSYAFVTESLGSFAAPELTYHPRVALGLDNDLSLSLGAPVSLGFNFSSSGGSYLIYELPVSMDFNFGFAAMERSRSDFGGFVGAGYGMLGMAGFGSVSGLYAHLGGRFFFQDRPISLSGFTYQTFDTVSIYGVRAIYEITDF